MGSVSKIILQRLGLGLVTLFVVSIVIFTAVNLLPGDFAQSILGQGATKDAVEAIRKDLGLDQPFFVRYLDWLSGAVRGDLGTSFAAANFSSFVGSDAGSGLGTVAQTIAPRFENTMFLAGVTAMIAVPLAVFLGVLAALYRETILIGRPTFLRCRASLAPSFSWHMC